MLLHWLLDLLTGKNKEAWKEGRIRGTAVLVKKAVLDIGDFHASLLDRVDKMLGKDKGVFFKLISATAPADPTNGKMGKEGNLEEMVVTIKSKAAGESVFKVTFDWDGSQGIPGAVIVSNTYHSEFLLKTLTLDGVPGKGTVVFVANSWIYPGADRVFFTNDRPSRPAKPCPSPTSNAAWMALLVGGPVRSLHKEDDLLLVSNVHDGPLLSDPECTAE